MALKDDGDIVRGVGFVTIYAAYLEEQIDELLEVLHRIKSITDADRKKPLSTKLTETKKRLQVLEDRDIEILVDNLMLTKGLLEARHEVVHSRIYAPLRGAEDLRPSRPNQPRRSVTSGELYDLANKLDACSRPLAQAVRFDAPKAVARWESNAIQ